MSGTTTIETGPVTRRSRADRPDRQIHREEPETEVSIEGRGFEAPEDALAESQRIIKQRETERDQARQQAATAETARQTAEAQARAAQASRADDRTVAVQANLEAGKSEVSAAKLAYASARESGVVADEIAAQEALAQATFKVNEAQRELQWIQAQPKRQPQQHQTNVPSAAARQWMNDHPLYQQPDSVPGAADYKRRALELHNEAIESGCVNGSVAYIRHIDDGMRNDFGDDHGQVGGQRMSRERDDGYQPRGGEAMRPSGRSGEREGSGGWKTARIPLGHNGAMAVVKYQGPPDARRIQFANERDFENFREGAEVTYRSDFEKNEKLAIGKYVNDHIEAAADGYEDLKRGDGQAWGSSDR